MAACSVSSPRTIQRKRLSRGKRVSIHSGAGVSRRSRRQAQPRAADGVPDLARRGPAEVVAGRDGAVERQDVEHVLVDGLAEGLQLEPEAVARIHQVLGVS